MLVSHNQDKGPFVVEDTILDFGFRTNRNFCIAQLGEVDNLDLTSICVIFSNEN